VSATAALTATETTAVTTNAAPYSNPDKGIIVALFKQ
jgi:hypothetical protein